jgi:hypothetical protein
VQASLSGLIVRAEGGRGGTNTPGSSGAHGPGGGGGGGFVVSSGPLGSGSSVAGGPNGVTATANAYGATPGSVGTIRSSAALSIPGPPPGYACATSNLTLSKTVTNVTRGSQAVTDGTASPGDVLRYVVTFVVGGVLDVTEAVFSDAADLTWVTPSGNAALLCPPRTGQGAVAVPFTPSGGLYVVDVVQACGPLPPGAVGSVAFEVRVR